ncbi:MAG: DUF29 domain-containing protein [Candidatus Eremiobacteraeota bacterium]|nr:DUF29 domain-containing protein [Candidatus Eremiobacteraeota bacterium]
MREPKLAAELYDADFVLWLEEQGRALRQQRWADLDVPNLVEEVEALASSQRRELDSRIKVVLVHLLKLAHQPERNSRSWKITLLNQRDELTQLIAASPSLRRLVPESIQRNYPRARRLAVLETGLSLKRFPPGCPFGVTDVLDGV